MILQEPHPDILETFVLYLSSAGSTDSAPGVSRRTYYWGPLDQPVQSWERIVTKEEGKLISGGGLVSTSFARELLQLTRLLRPGTTGLRTWCVTD